MFKVKIKYVDKLPNEFAGKFYGIPFFPVIKILKEYKEDKGLLEHELTHYKQYKRTLMFFELLYSFKYFRLKFEVEAYKKQLEYCPDNLKEYCLDKFAEFISTKYKLNISKEKAKHLLVEQN